MAKRKSVYELIHGEGGILAKLQAKTEEKKSESDKSSIKKAKNEKENEKKEEKSSASSSSKSKSNSNTNSQSVSKRIITPYIEFNCGNFLKMDLTEASFIFCNSTCFTNELLLQISQKVTKEAPNGCIVVTFTKKLPFLNKSEWDIKRGFKRLMSWGVATVFVHKRIKSMNNTRTSSSSSHTKTNNDSLYSDKTSSNSSKSETSK